MHQTGEIQIYSSVTPNDINYLFREVMLMKRLIMVFLLLVLLTACKPEDKKYNSLNTVYTLNATLNDEDDTLTVSGEVSYYNVVEDLDEIYLQIYPNAVNPTTNSSNVQFEYLTIDNKEMDISFLGDDSTYMHFDLTDEVPLNERVSIEFKYTFHYWDIDRIIEIDDNYYVTMFFYPFVPVYDEDGWNVEPYSFLGESYFNTVGDYYVTVNVPEDYLVATSGGLIRSNTNNNRTISQYEVKDARDFSFSASTEYNLYEREINSRQYKIYSMEPLSNLLVDEYFGYLETTFNVMEEGVGPYYYDHFTLELGHIYGMESTAVVYCDMNVSEGTIVHEAIHQWFYSMIGNDQSDEPFLDEALTTYMTAYYYEAIYGNEGYNGYLNVRSSLREAFAVRFNLYQGESIIRHLTEYGDGYGYLVYYHGPTIYRYYVTYFLENDTTRFMDALKVYYNTYNKDIATIDEFFTLLEDTTGEQGTKAWLYEQANNLQDLENEGRE